MSHLCKVTTQFRDADALAHACQALGWELQHGGRVRYYGGLADACTYVVVMHGESFATRYTIGFQQQADGTYAMLIDNAIQGPVTAVGRMAGQTPRIVGLMTDAYNYAVIEAQAALEGWQMTVEQDADGTRHITLEGGNLVWQQ